MKYRIIAEAHEGAFSVDEEVLGSIEAATPEKAIAAWASKDPRLTWAKSWNCWIIGHSRKVFVKEYT